MSTKDLKARIKSQADERKDYDHEYRVRFNYEKDNGYWSAQEVSYYSRFKGDHELVQQRWEKDYEAVKKELIYVHYV